MDRSLSVPITSMFCSQFAHDSTAHMTARRATATCHVLVSGSAWSCLFLCLHNADRVTAIPALRQCVVSLLGRHAYHGFHFRRSLIWSRWNCGENSHLASQARTWLSHCVGHSMTTRSQQCQSIYAPSQTRIPANRHSESISGFVHQFSRLWYCRSCFRRCELPGAGWARTPTRTRSAGFVFCKLKIDLYSYNLPNSIMHRPSPSSPFLPIPKSNSHSLFESDAINKASYKCALPSWHPQGSNTAPRSMYLRIWIVSLLAVVARCWQLRHCLYWYQELWWQDDDPGASIRFLVP